MALEHEKRKRGKAHHSDLASASGARQGAGEKPGATLPAGDPVLPATTLREATLSPMRRRADRRQTSALIAFWGEVERRSGVDQRASPSRNDIDEAEQ